MTHPKEESLSKRGEYTGRTKLLKDISSRSDSTKRYLLEHLKMQLNRSGTKKQFRKLARKLGVRIKKLELR